MKRIGYRNGYKIQIKNGFYEVIDGKRICHYGYCRNNSTIQEIANKTILQEEVMDARQQRNRTTYQNTANYNRQHYSSSVDYLHIKKWRT